MAMTRLIMINEPHNNKDKTGMRRFWEIENNNSKTDKKDKTGTRRFWEMQKLDPHTVRLFIRGLLHE